MRILRAVRTANRAATVVVALPPAERSNDCSMMRAIVVARAMRRLSVSASA
jgi:hypothetical protein